MDFEWDESKRLSNVAKHGVDFLRARTLFDGRPLRNKASDRGDEQRVASTGLLDDLFYTVIWTTRGPTRRIISARRARESEERAYRELYG